MKASYKVKSLFSRFVKSRDPLSPQFIESQVSKPFPDTLYRPTYQDQTSQATYAKAHGKMILAGEHAVVYGHPALALPIPLAVTVVVTDHPAEHRIRSDYYNGLLVEVPGHLMGLRNMVEGILGRYEVHSRFFQFKVTSTLPIGKGLGSSAAVAGAMAKALVQHLGYEMTDGLYDEWVDIAEKVAHGTPSGLDMIASRSEYPIFFRNRQSYRPLVINKVLTFLIVDSGQKGETGTAVKMIRERMDVGHVGTLKAINEIGSITKALKKVLRSGGLHNVGSLMNNNHRLLTELGVSTPIIDHLQSVALKHGALGAKLTGGGLGGCMVVLLKDVLEGTSLSKTLLQEGAYACYLFEAGHPEICMRFGGDLNEN